MRDGGGSSIRRSWHSGATGVCGEQVFDGGDQRDVLLTAEAAVLSGLERADARGFCVRREGVAVPDAHAQAEERGQAAGKFFCEWIAGAGQEAGADSVAVSSAVAI